MKIHCPERQITKTRLEARAFALPTRPANTLPQRPVTEVQFESLARTAHALTPRACAFPHRSGPVCAGHAPICRSVRTRTVTVFRRRSFSPTDRNRPKRAYHSNADRAKVRTPVSSVGIPGQTIFFARSPNAIVDSYTNVFVPDLPTSVYAANRQ